jgi:hypothetical protein
MFGILLLSSALSVTADDSTGQTLHDQNCLSCHGTEVYTRKDRFIHSMDALTSRVAFCARNASKVDWDRQQIDAVARYLDDNFYHF